MNPAPLVILFLVGVITFIGIAVGNTDGDDDLSVFAENNLLKITNTGDTNVEITDLVINNRQECWP